MTHKIMFTAKEPDEFYALISELKLDDATRKEYFEFSEYATFELEIDSALRVVSGRIVPRSEM